jgi:hypothetical protein
MVRAAERKLQDAQHEHQRLTSLRADLAASQSPDGQVRHPVSGDWSEAGLIQCCDLLLAGAACMPVMPHPHRPAPTHAAALLAALLQGLSLSDLPRTLAQLEKRIADQTAQVGQYKKGLERVRRYSAKAGLKPKSRAAAASVLNGEKWPIEARIKVRGRSAGLGRAPGQSCPAAHTIRCSTTSHQESLALQVGAALLALVVEQTQVPDAAHRTKGGDAPVVPAFDYR